MDEIDIPGFHERRPAREPLINAPWTILTLCLGLVALYVAQGLLLSDSQVKQLALSPATLRAGDWQGLFTSLFLHGSWPHVLMNSVAVLAFGPPVARLMGTGARGAPTFALFYLTCGVIAGLGYVVLNLNDAQPLVGASGAISGLLGAASRLIQGRGRIGPIFGSTVLGMGAAWIIVNVILGVSGLTPGANGMTVAWQAHVVGYIAGVLLIGPFARLAGAQDVAFTQ
ncbi:MAG: rhomboid family intramembrane serine protease [Caulobacterales bacterium]